MYSIQSLISVKERVPKILTGQYIHTSSLTLNLKINSGHLLYNVLVYKVWSLSSKGFWWYRVVNIFVCPVWPLDLLTLRYVAVVYFPWCTSLQSLKSVMRRVLKILSGQYIPLCLVWPLDLLTSKSIMVIYFLWCTSLQSLKPANGSQDIEYSVYSYV